MRANRLLRNINQVKLSDLEKKVKLDLIQKYNDGDNYFEYSGSWLGAYCRLFHKDKWVIKNCINPITESKLLLRDDIMDNYRHFVVVEFR